MMKIISLFFCATISTSAWAAPGMDLSAGGTPKFFTGYKDLMKSGAADSRIRDLISAGKIEYDMGYGRLDLHAPVPAIDSKDWPNRFSFGLTIEGAGGMGNPDPLKNSLGAAHIFAGLFRGTFEGPIYDDIYLTTSLIVGAGSEKQQEFVDSGSAISRASRQATDVIGGLDVQLAKTWRFRRSNARVISTLQSQETMFKAISPKTEGAVRWEMPAASHDWLFRNDLLVSRFNAHVILGKHPYPSALLPRVWNRVSVLPGGFKANFSAGGGVTANLGGKTEGALLGGFYAGKWGGELRINSPDEINVRVSSYGIPNSIGGMRTFTQRAYGIAIDIAL